jgi:hydroxypyruvate isomerase
VFRLSACVALLFADERGGLPERVRAAAAAGCEAIDLWGWRELDLDELAAVLEETRMTVAMMLVDPPGRLVDTTRLPEFVGAVEDSAAAAARIGCEALVVLPGESVPGAGEAEQDAAIVDGLQAAAGLCAEAGVRLLLEPLNTRRDHPGTYVSTTRHALDLAERADRPEVGILYDVYHSAMMGEDPVDVLGDRSPLVGHVHVADTGGRHEPGTGTIAWSHALDRLWAIGYRGFLGLEYVPTVASARSLTHLRATLDAFAPR